jgi:hypothetical protein
MATAEEMAQALSLLEAYHYRSEYDLETMNCVAYRCRLCGMAVESDDKAWGESVADAVAAIPHRECVMLSIRKLVGNPWTKSQK